MESKVDLLKRIARSLKRHGGKNAFLIVKHRIKKGFKVMFETNPDIANELKLPNSELKIQEKERLFYWGEYETENWNIDEGFFHNLYHKLAGLPQSRGLEEISIINSGVTFDPNYNQRPLNLAKYLAENKHLVIFVSWQWELEEKIENAYKEVYPNVFEIPMYKFIGSFPIFTEQLLKKFNWRSKQYFITLPSRHFLRLLVKFREVSVIVNYDIMDEWEEFAKSGQAPWYIKDVEEAIILAADAVFSVSPSLARKFGSIRSDIHVNPNGYSAAALKKTNRLLALKNKSPKLKIGYFGHLTEAWFDWDLVFAIAGNHPQVTFEIIGYGCSDETIAKIKQFGNIQYLGKKQHQELINYAKTWSAGLIPFKVSTLSEAVDPIKIYEYFYFGIPSIASGIPHLKDYPYSWVINTAADFARILPQVLDSRKKMATDKVLADYLVSSEWDNRFRSLLKLSKENIVFADLVED